MDDPTRAGYQDTSSAVDVAKQACGIVKPNPEMDDGEIRKVCKWLAERAPDTFWVDGKPMLGRMGIDVMLFITITEFPRFYEKYDLAQFN